MYWQTRKAAANLGFVQMWMDGSVQSRAMVRAVQPIIFNFGYLPQQNNFNRQQLWANGIISPPVRYRNTVTSILT